MVMGFAACAGLSTARITRGMGPSLRSTAACAELTLRSVLDIEISASLRARSFGPSSYTTVVDASTGVVGSESLGVSRMLEAAVVPDSNDSSVEVSKDCIEKGVEGAVTKLGSETGPSVS